MVERSIISEIAEDINNGKGCAMAEKLNLLALTDRVNVFLEVSKILDPDKSYARLSGATEGYIHMEALASVPAFWFARSIYEENYAGFLGRSHISCVDYSPSGERLRARSFVNNYETKWE